MTYNITVEDRAVYEIDASEYPLEEAKNLAWDMFNQRRPRITVKEISNKTKLRWAVVNPDGTFAGVPCESEGEARELACQKEGRTIFKMDYDKSLQAWK